MSDIRVTVFETNVAVNDLGTDRKRESITQWLSPPHPSTNYNEAHDQHHEGTGHWFLGMETYGEWKTRRNSILWLHGISGCGKTVLSSTIITDLQESQGSPLLLYFYFDFRDDKKQTLRNMICSLIDQLYAKREESRSPLDRRFQSCHNGNTQPTCKVLCEDFLDMIRQVKEVWIVLDGLDECTTRDGSWHEGLLSWMAHVHSSEETNAHLLVTSRPEEDIQSRLEPWTRIEDRMELPKDTISNDIRAYVEHRIQGEEFKRWRLRPKVQEEIRNKVVSKGNGM